MNILVTYMFNFMECSKYEISFVKLAREFGRLTYGAQVSNQNYVLHAPLSFPAHK
jgi:hypothetical protein